MAKPVSGYLGYDTDADRPTVLLRDGRKLLATEDDVGGTITEVDSADGSLAVTDPTGPNVDLAVANTPALQTSGADVSVSAASPPTTGQVLTATSATTATWQNVLAPIFWAHRTGSEHADSDEFTSSSLGANWSIRRGDTHAVVTPVGDVDPTSAVTVVTSPRFTANYRGTFAAVQNLQTSTQPIELARVMAARPANFHLRFRVSMPSWKHIGGAGGTTDARSSVFLAPDTAGLPDLSSEYAQLGWVTNASNQCVARAVGVTGGVATVSENTQALVASPFDTEFILSMDNSNVVTYYLRNEAGRVRLATHTLSVNTGSSLWIIWMYHGNIGGGTLIATCDYILQQNDLIIPS